jgi:hypothetical protein
MAFDAEDGAPVGMERPRLRGYGEGVNGNDRLWRNQSFFFNSFLPISPKPYLFILPSTMTRARIGLKARHSIYSAPVSHMDRDLVGTTDWTTTAFSESDNDWS